MTRSHLSLSQAVSNEAISASSFCSSHGHFISTDLGIIFRLQVQAILVQVMAILYLQISILYSVYKYKLFWYKSWPFYIYRSLYYIPFTSTSYFGTSHGHFISTDLGIIFRLQVQAILVQVMAILYLQISILYSVYKYKLFSCHGHFISTDLGIIFHLQVRAIFMSWPYLYIYRSLDYIPFTSTSYFGSSHGHFISTDLGIIFRLQVQAILVQVMAILYLQISGLYSVYKYKLFWFKSWPFYIYKSLDYIPFTSTSYFHVMAILYLQISGLYSIYKYKLFSCHGHFISTDLGIIFHLQVQAILLQVMAILYLQISGLYSVYKYKLFCFKSWPFYIYRSRDYIPFTSTSYFHVMAIVLYLQISGLYSVYKYKLFSSHGHFISTDLWIIFCLQVQAIFMSWPFYIYRSRDYIPFTSTS